MVTERFSERGLDIPGRQAAHVAGDDERLDRVGARHTLAEESRGERLGGAPQLRACEGQGAPLN